MASGTSSPQRLRHRHRLHRLRQLVRKPDVPERGLIALVLHQALQGLGFHPGGVDRGERPAQVVEAVRVARRSVLVVLPAGPVNRGPPLGTITTNPASSAVG